MTASWRAQIICSDNEAKPLINAAIQIIHRDPNVPECETAAAGDFPTAAPDFARTLGADIAPRTAKLPIRTFAAAIRRFVPCITSSGIRIKPAVRQPTAAPAVLMPYTH